MSMRPSSSASSISLVNRPLPPMSDSGWFRILSPVVLMMMISSAPSSFSSGNAFCGRQRERWREEGQEAGGWRLCEGPGGGRRAQPVLPEIDNVAFCALHKCPEAAVRWALLVCQPPPSTTPLALSRSRVR